MLLRQVDHRIGLSQAVAGALHHPRNQDRIRHGLRDLVAQRLYALCYGQEDLNDHAALGNDRLILKTLVQSADFADYADTKTEWPTLATHLSGVATLPGNIQNYLR